MGKQKKIFIADQEIDVNGAGDFKVGVDFQLSDIQDLSVRANSKSTSIDIPASAGNKKTFGFAEDWNAAEPADQTTAPTARLEVEGTNLLHGLAKVQVAETDNKQSKYQLSILGDNADWRNRLLKKMLTDLDYSSDNHVYDYNTVKTSWTVSAQRNYVYDLIDRGLFTGKVSVPGQAVNIEDMYPAISFSSLISKIFTAIGYKVQSNFISGALFTKLYWPFINGMFKQPDNWGDDKKFKAVQGSGTLGGINYTANALTSPFYPMFFDNDSSNDGFDTSNRWKNIGSYAIYSTQPQLPTTYKSFQAITTCKYTFHYKFTYALTANNGLQGSTVNLHKRDPHGAITYLDQQFLKNVAGTYTFEYTTTVALNAGDKVTMSISPGIGTGNISVGNHIPGVIDCFLELVEMIGPFPVEYGNTVNINANLPEQVSQLDFIQGLKDLFNLYFLADVETRTIYIEPRDDFYSGTAIDWSKKLDRSRPVTIEYLGDTYTKRLWYRFGTDSNDNFVQEWEKQNNDSYAGQMAALKNVFSKDEITIIDNNLFAATWMDVIPAPLQGLKTVKLPRLWSKVTQPAKSTAFKPRILYYDGIKTIDWSDGWAFFLEDKFSLPNSTTMINWQNTLPRFYFYGEAVGEYNLGYDNTSTAHGCLDKYFANTLKIIDDSRLVTANMYLKDVDISNFDFRTPVYIEIEGNGAYFEVQSINGYDPDVDDSTTVALIKQVGKSAVTALPALPKKHFSPQSSNNIQVLTTMVNNISTTVITVNGIPIITIINGIPSTSPATPIFTEANNVLVPVVSLDANGNLSNVYK